MVTNNLISGVACNSPIGRIAVDHYRKLWMIM
jgi:hypothetical protein